MKINIQKINSSFHMKASNEEGAFLEMDGAKEIGGEGKGMRPMQLLLAAVGGCSSIDVIRILQKQKQTIEAFDVEVEGTTEKVEEHKVFRDIILHFKLSGAIDPDKAEKAVKLSLDKYCSVSKILEPTSKITYKVSVNGIQQKQNADNLIP